MPRDRDQSLDGDCDQAGRIIYKHQFVSYGKGYVNHEQAVFIARSGEGAVVAELRRLDQDRQEAVERAERLERLLIEAEEPKN
jgi:hypothetical protein